MSATLTDDDVVKNLADLPSPPAVLMELPNSIVERGCVEGAVACDRQVAHQACPVSVLSSMEEVVGQI